MEQIAAHDVAFDGGTSGVNGLTWAQKSLLRGRCMPHLDGPRNINVRMIGSLAGVPDLAAVLRAVGRTVARHEALRTLYPREADRVVRQTVVDSGSIRVTQHAAKSAHDAAGLDELARVLAYPGFAADALPLRVAVVTVRGEPTDLVLALHHGSVDAAAAALVADQIRALAINPEADAPIGRQPREIAACELGETARRYALRADDRDRAALRSQCMPPLDGPRIGPDGIVYNLVFLDSPAAAAACAALAARYRVTATAVLFTAYACALAGRLGLKRCAVNVIASNRQSAETRDSVANLVGKVLLAVDADPAGDFGAQCRAANAALIAGYRFGRRDPDLYARALAETAAESGRPTANPYVVNIRNVEPDPAEDPDHGRAADSAYGSYPGIADDDSGELMFDVWAVSRSAHISLGTESSTFSAADLEQLLRAFEARLVSSL